VFVLQVLLYSFGALLVLLIQRALFDGMKLKEVP